jgi:UDP-3-O-[3-hydroxymyristoyl] glucosamine N-acyltransferase
MKLRDIGTLLNAEIEGSGDIEIARVAKIDEAGQGDITFLANPKYAKYLGSTKASAVIVSRTLTVAPGERLPALVRVDDPYVAFLRVLVTFSPPESPFPAGIHPTAVIAPSATIGKNARIGAHVVIGERVRLGDDAVIGHGVVLGDGVEVGPGSLLYANVTVREGCRIGARVIIHSGTVIGSDGFGFAPKKDGTYEKIPQLGIVVIEDDVELGANCAVDRATLGETRICKGTKLDNLIQVAHNVVIGENTVIAAQAGISGSTRIGANCMIGGQVGFAGHIEIADRTKFGAQSGVHHSVTEQGGGFFGSPALPQREGFRVSAAMTHLPDLLATVRELKAKVERLENDRSGSPAASKPGNPER